MNGAGAPEGERLAREVQALLRSRGATLAIAESLTGGLLGAALTGVPGASAVFRGGAVCYATDTKERLLGVDGGLLTEHGAVHPEVASAMASGVRRLFSADFGLAVTGVAGPSMQDGRPPGTVYAAAADPEGRVNVVYLYMTGDRDEIRKRTVTGALELLRCAMADNTDTEWPSAE